MTKASDYLENEILDHIFGKGSYAPETLHVALCSAEPIDSDDGDTMTEVSYTSYARQATSGATWTAAAAGLIQNAAQITFPTATGGSDTASHIAILNAATSGDLLFYGTLSSPLAITTGVQPYFAIGNIDITAS